MNNATVMLGGEPWEIKFVRLRDLPKGWWGSCDWEKKQILVRKDLSPKNVLDTLIREMRHGQHAVLFEAESFVDSTSTELANGLIATGLFPADPRR